MAVHPTMGFPGLRNWLCASEAWKQVARKINIGNKPCPQILMSTLPLRTRQTMRIQMPTAPVPVQEKRPPITQKRDMMLGTSETQQRHHPQGPKPSCPSWLNLFSRMENIEVSPSKKCGSMTVTKVTKNGSKRDSTKSTSPTPHSCCTLT